MDDDVFANRYSSGNSDTGDPTATETGNLQEPAQFWRSSLSARTAMHIKKTWPRLAFTHEDLFLGGARNPLLPHAEGAPYYIYVSDKEDITAVKKHYADVKARLLEKIRTGAIKKREEDILDIEIRRIPRDSEGKISIPHDQHGLLHIPEPGISPGTERYVGTLYGWDTAFIIRGLVHDNQWDLAWDLLMNHLYEQEHYGTVLNANATFCLDNEQPRSQLPLLASKALILYNNRDKLNGHRKENKADWLKRVVSLVEDHHRYWVTGAHLDEETGLSRFDTAHDTPGIDVLYGEAGHYYAVYKFLWDQWKALEQEWDAYRNNPESIKNLPKQDREALYYIKQYLAMDENGQPQEFAIDLENGTVRGLTPAFFRSDWAMRESGFDCSHRFGPMNMDIINTMPVCLNSFRYKMEKEIAQIYAALAMEEPKKDEWRGKQWEWEAKSEKTGEAIRKVFWDDGWPATSDGAERISSFRDRRISPLLGEFNLEAFRPYDFVMAALAPLWVGAATDQQADQVIENIYPLLKTEFGIMASTEFSGCQWDAPMLWAPFQIIAVEALERCGRYHSAKDLARRYVTALEEEYERTGTIWEKLEGIRGTSETSHYMSEGVGYHHNDAGFGWSSAAHTELLIAIERLQKKIKGEHLTEPSIETNLNVPEQGSYKPVQDSPDKIAVPVNLRGYAKPAFDDAKEDGRTEPETGTACATGPQRSLPVSENLLHP